MDKTSSKLINQSINQIDLNYKKQNSFHIRRRKTFLVEQKPRTHKKDIKRRNSNIYSSYTNNLYNQRKMSLRNNRRSSLHLTKKDFRDIEEDVRYSILEMRRSCLWEIRRQSHDIFNIFKDTDIKIQTKSELGTAMKNFSIKYLEDLENNNKEEININKKLKKCKTFNIKNNKNKKKDNNINANKIKNINNNMNDKNCDKLNEDKKYISSTIIVKMPNKKKKNFLPGEKFRFLSRGGQIIDSHNENESDEDEGPDIYLFNPETKFIFIFDALITFGVFYSLIYIPIELSKNYCFCTSSLHLFNILINLFFDILFIIDLIIGFFREFYTKEDEKLVKNNFRIINNYISGWFFLDLLTSLPINILIFYFCKNHSEKICFTFEQNSLIDLFMLLRCLKAIKIFKITTRKKNQFVTEIREKCSDYTIIDNFIDLFNKISFVIVGLHILSCIHIFIGRHIYPGWIFKNNFQNYSSLNLYMISLYYMITTMTTVGYGEIQSDSFVEIIFRIVLLAVGIVCYSWLISSISNGINKQSYASINYSNECLLLESIRRSNRDLPYKVYIEIKKHLEYKNFRQKKFDKDLLINSLPYALKNSLIFSMYKSTVNNFHFFKNISNTNFIVEALSYFTPISGKKNDIFIKENEIIEEIYFVLEGRIALEVPINMDNPEESANRYLSNEFLDFAFDFEEETNYNPIPELSYLGNSNLMDSDIHGTKHGSFLSSFIYKKKESKKNYENSVYLKIHDIHKNEDFGDVYSFFGKRTPFALRAKTKRVKLYGIKKDNFANLCEEYLHLIRRIQKKKKHNYKIIKNILIKTISKFCDSKGIKIKDQYKEKINKAIKELQKEHIPIEILKNAQNKNEINEIDEEINNTIKEFDSQILIKQEGIIGKKKKKLNKLFTTTESNSKKNKNKFNLYNTNIKGTAINKGIKNTFLENFNLEGTINNYHFTNSIKGNNKLNFKKIKKNKKERIINNKKKKKKKKKKKIKTIISSNVMSNMNLKGYNFDFSESDESIKTVKINEENNESFESSPNTIKILPQSLINLLITKINYQQLLNHKENSVLNSRKIESINNNNNNLINNNFINIIGKNSDNKNQSKININSNIKSKFMSSSGFTFDNIINKQYKTEKELNNIDSEEKSSYSKKNPQFKKSNYSRIKSIRDTLTPEKNFTPKNLGKGNNIGTFSQNHFNNYQKCSITNNNILLKLDENILNKNYSFNLDSLSSTSAESFQIKRSYKNINEVTNGAYIKEKKFQNDTLQFILDYKNNKNKMQLKRKKSNSTLDVRESRKNIGNFLSFENNIKHVKSRMSIYLNQKIKLFNKKTLNNKRKSHFKQNSNNKNKKIYDSINSSDNSIYNNSNNLNRSFKEDTITKLKNFTILKNDDS